MTVNHTIAQRSSAVCGVMKSFKATGFLRMMAAQQKTNTLAQSSVIGSNAECLHRRAGSYACMHTCAPKQYDGRCAKRDESI
eukprot:6177645-Pleurochrysis_carterae.AAC.1